MPLSPCEILESHKSAPTLQGWQPPDAGGFIRWSTPLDIAGATVEGLFLYVRCLRSEPGRDVSFVLAHEPAGKSEHIDRIDWRPIKAHVNRFIGPAEYRGLRINGSHRHHLLLNTKDDGTLRGNNLPIAAPLESEPKNFEELVAFVAACYNIAGLGNLLAPAWEGDLFT